MDDHLIIIPGGLNTDIIGLGVEELLHAGELTLGGSLKIGPGGKARNMVQMAAAYLGENKVAMIGRSCKDPFGLWKIPIQSLLDAGVDIRFVKILAFEKANPKYPGVALIPVDKNGKNQIYVLPGVNADFCIQDVEAAERLFQPGRIMIIALEIPFKTAKFCIDLAASRGMKVILDPGGMSDAVDDLLNDQIFLIKPNEHEAEKMTGVPIHDFSSAEIAAQSLIARGIQHVLITHGDKGAYFFDRKTRMHLPCPNIKKSEHPDETGCGDQVTAIVASCLAEGFDLQEATRRAILAGTLQFHRVGIQPVSKNEMAPFLK